MTTATTAAALAAVPEVEPVHVRHSVDGYPLCWPMDQEGDFTGTYDETKADCGDCQAILQEPPC